MSEPTADQPDAPNPLAEAAPSSLEELFSRDLAGIDRELRRRTISELVLRLREARLRWKVEEASGAARTSKPKRAPKSSATSLSDLGLE